MKKLHTLLLMMVVLATSLTFTSCDDYYAPPGATYDPNLVGSWELVSVNGKNVYGYQKNWLDFYRNGSGVYYYYVNGLPYEMDLTYDVDYYYNQSNLYIYYADGRSAYMNYWFNSNYTYLYMQWSEGGFLNTYVYAYVNTVDWAPALQPRTDMSPLFMPGVTPSAELEESLFNVSKDADTEFVKPLIPASR